LQRGKQFGDAQREALVVESAAPRRGGAGLAQERGRGHLPAGHAVDGIVDEEDGDLLAAVGRVQNLRRANRRKVAVTLVGDHYAVRAGALHRGGDGGGAAVCRLHVADVEIVVGEYRAAHRTHKDGAVLQPEVFQRLCHELVRDSVAAARTV